jgi:hypothetical protein
MSGLELLGHGGPGEAGRAGDNEAAAARDGGGRDDWAGAWTGKAPRPPRLAAVREKSRDRTPGRHGGGGLAGGRVDDGGGGGTRWGCDGTGGGDAPWSWTGVCLGDVPDGPCGCLGAGVDIVLGKVSAGGGGWMRRTADGRGGADAAGLLAAAAHEGRGC